MTEDTPPVGQQDAQLAQIAGAQKIMLAVAVLGTAVFISAMFLLIAMP
jgi:hypothetical protein